MIKINLLSPSDKEDFKWEKIDNLVKGCTIWMVLAQVFFMAAFFLTLEYLKIEEKAVVTQLEQVRSSELNREMIRIESDLLDYSKKIESISDIRSEHLYWSLVFEEVTGVMSDGVRLESISSQLVVPQDKKKSAPIEEKFLINLTGVASTRKELLEFEESLKKSELFSDIECDDSNYVESNNIDFRYSLYVYKKKLLE